LSGEALTTLKAHRHLRGELVFCHEDGGMLEPDRTNRAVWRARRKAALPQLGIGHAQFVEPQNENGDFTGGRSRDRTCDFVRVKDALYR
jgi:hypothetical protein